MPVTPKVFRKSVEKHFDDLLATAGFKRTKSTDERFGFSVIYRNDSLYVNIGATLHPHDYPYYLWLKLGEGGDDFPESDWNGTALWRIVRDASPSDYASEEDIYDIQAALSEADVEEKMRRLAASCERFGKNFLGGDLDAFKKARAAQNQGREPYKIYSPKKEGGYGMTFDEESSRLKEKFSK